jgi:hypothetical protein
VDYFALNKMCSFAMLFFYFITFNHQQLPTPKHPKHKGFDHVYIHDKTSSSTRRNVIFVSLLDIHFRFGKDLSNYPNLQRHLTEKMNDGW